jgi:hypothetical protein
MEFAFDAEKDMAFHAPMVGEIAWRVLDHAYTDASKVLRAPIGAAALACVLRSLDL